MTVSQAVIRQVSDELQHYVYALVDPATSVPFYIGKGKGLRHAAHGAESLIAVDEDASERGAKVDRIRSIRQAGLEPEVWILRYGLNRSDYTSVEASVIDVLMSFPIKPRPQNELRAPLSERTQLTNARREKARGGCCTSR